MDSKVFLDMGDGDEKMVSVADGMITIVPHGNNETWKVTAQVKGNTPGGQCTALVDFDVPGKPNPPPIKLLISYWPLGNTDGSLQKGAWEFTDPGDEASPRTPLNEWVMYPAAVPASGSSSAWPCPTRFAEGVMRKPNPPPCKLVATLWRMSPGTTGGPDKYALEFTDPTDACAFGEPGSPLNEWVSVSEKNYIPKALI
eukprot:gene17123-2500_t